MRGVLAGLLACVIAGIAALDTLQVRGAAFADSCVYDHMRSVPHDVDVFIIGSSRMRYGINPDELAMRLGIPNTRVINFGHGHSTIDADYLIIDELLRNHHRIALFLVEANVEPELDASNEVDFSTYSLTRHYVQLVSFRQLFTSTPVEPTQPYALRLYDTIHLLIAKIESGVRATLIGRVPPKPGPKSNLVERPNICWHIHMDDVEVPGKPGMKSITERRKEKRDEARRTFLSEHADWLDEGFYIPTLFSDKHRRIHTNFMRQIVELVHDRGSQIAFTNLRAYFSWPPGPDFAAEFEQRIGAPLLLPDKNWLMTIHANGYRDARHLAGPGRAAYSAWLAEQIVATGLWSSSRETPLD